MKKSTLALSVAAALGGLGFATSSMAMGLPIADSAGHALTAGTSYPAAVAAADAMVLNQDGIGHQLVVPYFTTQGDNATLIQITNHDTLRGKLVKVRFRGAANSDDLYDFTLAMSPGDVWTAAVSKDAATGLSKLVSTDASCVVPATAKSSTFLTNRVDPTLTGDALAAQTREGYVEIINMADVPQSYANFNALNTLAPATSNVNYANLSAAQKAATLYGTIKHASGVAACDASVLAAALLTDVTGVNAAAVLAAANARGMTDPTGGLSADWIILNQTKTAAWSGPATALEARVAATGARAAGSLVFFPQAGGAPAAGNIGVGVGGVATGTFTADPLLANGVVTPQFYDLPDLSTKYVVAATAADAAAMAGITSAALQVGSVQHSYVTSTDIGGTTDVVFSQPTRRYHVAVNYKAADAVAANLLTTTGTTAVAVFQPTAPAAFYQANNTAVINRQVCLTAGTVGVPGVTTPGTGTAFNREEGSPSTGFVISPGTVASNPLCGETSVVSINQGSTASSAALTGSVARTDVTLGTGFDNGWMNWTIGTKLPMVATAFIRANNGATYYGFRWPAKVTR